MSAPTWKGTAASLLFKAVLASLLWFGLVEGVQGARNVALFYIWFVSLLTFAVFADDEAREKAQSRSYLPEWFALSFNLLVIATLLWFGRFWTASVFTVAVFLWHVTRAKEQPA